MIEYDTNGRVKYNPEFHFNSGKELSDYEKAYLCYYWDWDGVKGLSYSLGKTEAALQTLIKKMKKNGDFEHYKQVWEYIQYRGWKSNGDGIEEVDAEEIH